MRNIREVAGVRAVANALDNFNATDTLVVRCPFAWERSSPRIFAPCDLLTVELLLSNSEDVVLRLQLAPEASVDDGG